MKEKKSISVGGKLLFSIIAPFMITVIMVFSIIKELGLFIWENLGEARYMSTFLCVIPVFIVALFVFGIVTGYKSVYKHETGELGLLAIALNFVMLVVGFAMIIGV